MQPLTTAVSAGVTLSFGLLNLTVSVHSAVGEPESSGLRLVCANEHPATPVLQRYHCELCGAVDGVSAFKKGAASGDGFVVVPSTVLAQAKEASSAHKKTISLSVHPAGDVSGLLLPSGKTYYLSMKSPAKGALDTYTALGALVSTRGDLAFMCQFTLSTTASLFQLVVVGDSTLALRQMADASVVRQQPQLELSELNGQQLEMANLLADQSVTPFTLEMANAASTIVSDYVAAQPVPVPVAASAGPAVGGQVLDLTAALAAALEASKPAEVKRAPRKRAAKKIVPAVAS